MVERIGRVMRIKSLKFNTDELFERRKGFEEREDEERTPFSSVFQDEVKKKRESDENEKSTMTSAYHLDIDRPTHSIFYQGRGDISSVHRKTSYVR